MNSKHPKESHPFCNQMNHNIRPDGSCKECERLFREYPLNEPGMNDPIWAVMSERVRKINITYTEAQGIVADILKEEPKNSGLCIVSADAARRMIANRLAYLRSAFPDLPDQDARDQNITERNDLLDMIDGGKE